MNESKSNEKKGKKKPEKENEPSSPKKKTAGRPSLYDPIYCNLLIQHMAEGYSFEAFGGVVSVAKQTLYQWLAKHPEFMDAKKIGTQKSLLRWEQLGLAGTMGLKKTKSGIPLGNFSPGAWIFNMKNRFNWRDKHEHVGRDGERLSVAALVAKVEDDADDEG